MISPIVEELERRFLPAFRAETERLRREFPGVQINTWSATLGPATSSQWHVLGIDCCFLQAPPDECDNVALCIGVTQLTTNPTLCDAGVCWGHGAGEGWHATDLIDDPIPYSAEALDRIQAGLPLLYEALEFALRHPPFANEAV
jgi:hypothetical protein